MKKVTICFTVFISLLTTSSILGQSSQGPFEDLVGKEIKSDNIFMLWQETGGSTISFQKVIKYDIENDILDNQDNVARDFAGKEAGGSKQMVAASGNLNNDLYDDVVAAWEGLNGTIELYIPNYDSTAAMWNAASSHTIDGPITSEVNYLQGRILLELTDLNGSGRDEIIALYKGDDDNMHLEVYSTKEALEPVMLDSMTVAEVADLSFTYNPAALTVADLDGDGTNEIVIATVAPNSWEDDRWSISLKRIELSESDKLTLATENFRYADPASQIEYNNLRYTLGAGELSKQGKDDLLFAWSFDNTTSPTNNDTFLYSNVFNSGTNSFSGGDRMEYNVVNSSVAMDPMVINTGDLDGDGLDEVVFAAEGTHHVLDINESFNFEDKSTVGQNSSTFGISYDYLEVSDINQDGLDEFIVAVNRIVSGNDYFQLRAFSAYDATDDEWRETPGNVGQILIDEEIPEGSAGARRYAIAAGSFDGYKFRLGEPEYSVKTDDIQPLVILNAPPIHYDIFDGMEYDISNCSPVSDCNFNARYLTSEEESSTITTEMKSDFAISAGIGYSGSVTAAPGGVGASVNQEVYFDVNYGQNFSEKGEEGESITITERITATIEDRIYASIADYDIWEYPVYEGSQEVPTKFMLAMEPKNVRNQWFSSKSWNANRYIPSHEVGNILSYPSYAEVTDNPDVSYSIYSRPNSYQLDSTSDAVWDLDITNFSSTEQDTTREIGYDTKVHLSAYRFSSAGARTTLSTHKTTVKNRFNVTVDLKNLDLSYGESRYNVTPYVYWNNNDALVIDYAAEPERSAAGGVQTWWEDFYGNDPDPAFILPWRYDPEKGLGLSEDIRRFRTKDIFFDNYEPSAGDTLTITARIRNFSLIDSPAVTATFYAGDPDEGGELITGIDGERVVSTPDDIEAQRYSDVELQWLVPPDLPGNTRIFAVLNEDPEYAEIHQNNNKAYNILNSSGVITSIDGSSDTQPQTFKLHQSYPNPFNPTTTIGYELPQSMDVRIDVFNILGQRVAMLVNENKSAGYHEVSFDASNLSSGMYLYRISTGQFTQTRKMMLVK